MPAKTRSTGLSTPAPTAGDNKTNDGGAAKDPAPDVTISAADLQAIQQRIADLEAVLQPYTRRRRCRSNSESDYERASKRSNLEGKPPDVYWGENHQKLKAFIWQCEQNFDIDKCTCDITRVAYAGSYCRGTAGSLWGEYERRLEHRDPHIVTWDDM